jgi:type II secretory pathway pseudopilin PulG
MRPKRQSGFTLPEMVAVVGIAIVLAALSVPYLAAAMANLKVRSAADELAGLFQQARMRAVRDNKFYSVINNNALNAQVQGGCVDLNWNTRCGADEPSIEYPGEVQVVGAGAPSTLVITCGNATVACPGGYSGLDFFPEPTDAKPSFSARGLPCVGNPANTEPSWPAGAQCFILDPNTNRQVGFLYVLRYNGALGASYSAVAVTPAGRVTVWTYSGNVGGVDKWVR